MVAKINPSFIPLMCTVIGSRSFRRNELVMRKSSPVTVFRADIVVNPVYEMGTPAWLAAYAAKVPHDAKNRKRNVTTPRK